MDIVGVGGGGGGGGGVHQDKAGKTDRAASVSLAAVPDYNPSS